MKFRVTAQLGGLGNKTGPEIAWQWSPPSQGPRMLPALALLFFLLPRRNRCWQAVWVSVPLAIDLALAVGLGALLGMESEQQDDALTVFSALAFGLAAVWLLSPYLQGRTRWGTFLKVAVIVELAALGSFVVGRYGNGEASFADTMIGVAVLALVFGATLNLAGWSSRRRPSWVVFLLWLFVWIAAVLLVVFAVVSLFLGPPGALTEMVTALLVAAAVVFGFLSPFLLLSFNNAFYATRLRELLRLPRPAAAPPATPDAGLPLDDLRPAH